MNIDNIILVVLGFAVSIFLTLLVFNTDKYMKVNEQEHEQEHEYKSRTISTIPNSKNIVTVCRNCGANLNGQGKCEYCGTIYPENIFSIEQEPIITSPTNKSNMLISEVSEDIKNIKSEIDKIKEEI